MSTLQTLIDSAQKIKDFWRPCIEVCETSEECEVANHYIETIWNPAMDNVEKLVKEAFLAGQQSVLERARWMKIPKEFESKWNYYQGYSYEWAIGYNRMADDLLSAPLNDTEI